MRSIDADAVLYALVEEGYNNATKYGFRLGDTIKFTPTQVDEIVSKMPTVEPERKTGHWELDWKNNKATCSECGHTFKDAFDIDNWDNFCRHCGTRME